MPTYYSTDNRIIDRKTVRYVNPLKEVYIVSGLCFDSTESTVTEGNSYLNIYKYDSK